MSTRRNVAAIIMLLLMLAPFTMLTAPSSDVGHKALLTGLGLVVIALWRIFVALWGPVVALLTWGAAWPLYFLISWLLVAGLWPAPEGSWGHFAFVFPAWVAIVLLVGGMLVHLLEVEQRQASTTQSLRTSNV